LEEREDAMRRLIERNPRYIQQYPVAVKCTVDVEKHVTKTVTKKAPVHTSTLQQATVLVTKTVTTTSTLARTARSTSTMTATASLTTTSTVTVTATTGDETTTSWSTVAGPTPSVCGADNQNDGRTDGPDNYIHSVTGQGVGVDVFTDDTSIEACCLSCVVTEGCAVSYFDPNAEEGARCGHAMVDNCNASDGQYGYSRTVALRSRSGDNLTGQSIVVSNGYCGRWRGGGQQR
jgi:hypothetical protein